MQYLDIIGRSLAVYLFIIAAIRLFGKKELAQLSIVDLVFILLISNSVQNAMVGSDTSLPGGIIAAGALFLGNLILKRIIYKNQQFSHFLQGEPIMLIYKGKVKDKNLTRAEISVNELEAAVREHGVLNLKDVDLAVLEVDGNISVMSNDFQKKTSRRHKSHRSLNNPMS
ncbi:DUF421 domain-containing protein [Siphonobacter sp. SORGH_AS_0500]|uniref:DUF421 domain-containing protein n=2 Tax=unclassified Siphonobacter TaxID=2635712 RepID=UPI000CB98603|nr:YetF domain-containing protein [Siphonobacter sp. SORGH_AS_0500]MDR6195347.1 uncharacterized membrane protein YcaP (DUF421 family) [Siphonobacter sp. SORGH_AS_0500]PKK34701.1 hypothetical protein BWI96_20975 [Siphonobacter sp. SORGH_AS_0500]